MEGGNNNSNKKRERENDDDNTYVEASHICDWAMQTHSKFRLHEARWDRTIAELKDKGRAYILKLAQVTEIDNDADGSVKQLFSQIYDINRAIGDEAGFVVYFSGGTRMRYAYGSCLWTCIVGSAESYVVCEDEVAKIFSCPGSRNQKELVKMSDYKEMETFAITIAPHLGALKTFGIHCVDQDSIMCRDPLHYWRYVIVPKMGKHFHPTV